jgi:nitrate reductase gamma subunit
MHTLYEFVSGPLVWLAFIVFIGGSIYRLVTMFQLAKKKDPIVFTYMNLKYSLRSILHWVTPFGTVKWRKNPILTIAVFSFHIGLLVVPIFLYAHVILWKEAWDISWWTLSDPWADMMTLMVIIGCIFFFVRRLVLPEVRYLTTPWDYVILAIVAAPFITGFWTYHQWAGFRAMGILHILAGEILLIISPFTRLSHMIFSPFLRGYMGSEFGGVRKVRDW